MNYIRDLGGLKTIDNHTIKKGLLFRSSQLYKPNKKQIAYLKAIKLKRIIDLRNKQETLDEPNIDLGPLKYCNISLIDSNLNGVTHESKTKQLLLLKDMPTMKETYESLIYDDYSSNKIVEALREIVLNNEYPTLIHCVTGKDRAGVIVFFLLRILGVSYEQAMDDYLKQLRYYQTYARFLYLTAFLMSFDSKLALKAYDYFVVKKEFIDAVLEAIDKRYNSFDNFIHNYVGLTDFDINNFKDNLLI